MESQNNSFFGRFLLSAGSTLLMLVSYNLAMQPLKQMGTELVITILVVAVVASLLSGLLSAALIKRRPIAMILIGQLIGVGLLSFGGSL